VFVWFGSWHGVLRLGNVGESAIVLRVREHSVVPPPRHLELTLKTWVCSALGVSGDFLPFTRLGLFLPCLWLAELFHRY